MLEKFLEKDVDVLLLDGYNKMPIHYAAWTWNLDAMQILLYRGAQLQVRTPLGETPLQMAAQRGVPDVVECLLRHGADITACNKNRRTVLHYAVMRGGREDLEVLLRHGADPRVKDHYGMTPIQTYRSYIGISITRVG
jgi:ankyrin repeat protein